VVHVAGGDLIAPDEGAKPDRIERHRRDRRDQPGLDVPLQPPLSPTPPEHVEVAGPARHFFGADLTPIASPIVHDRYIADEACAHAVDLEVWWGHLAPAGGGEELTFCELDAIRPNDPDQIVREARPKPRGISLLDGRVFSPKQALEIV